MSAGDDYQSRRLLYAYHEAGHALVGSEEKTCLDCLITKTRPEVDREKAGRFIHPIQWQHQDE